jgi:predicted phage terminase large subunit-like protein
VLRIQSLQPDIRNGYLLFSRDQTELLRQLEQFPLGRHDDGPDALEGAVRLCKQGGRLTTLALRV